MTLYFCPLCRHLVEGPPVVASSLDGVICDAGIHIVYERPHKPTQTELDDLFRPDNPQGGLGK